MLHLYKPKFPTHIYLGVRKSASSWLWKQLVNHPEISCFHNKEINFFDENYELGINWYLNHFNCIKKCAIDFTPDYFNELCANRIYKTLPFAKFIICLRNPIDRAFSQWKFANFTDNSDSTDFFHSWLENWRNIKTQGLYDVHLHVFWKLFDKHNFLVLFYDDLEKNSKLFLEKVYTFLNVEHIFDNNYHNKLVPGGNHHWLRIFNKQIPYEEKYNVYHEYNKKYSIKDEQYKYMIDYYHKSIDNLNIMLNKDLSHWYDMTKRNL